MLRFGTDGVRGDADADLTDDFVVALGRAAARVLGPGRFLVGRDTRASGPRIEAALCRGLAAEGAQATALGVLPTPGVAYVAQREGAPAAVISASHNRWTDNGIKLLGPGGTKLRDEAEAAVEREVETVLAGAAVDAEPRWETVDRSEEYVAHVVGVLGGRDLGGMRVVLDCANGAASAVGAPVFARAGADVTVIHAEPDGRNINEGCGSTHPDDLVRTVRERHADLGLALDGDADRVIAVDERGAIVDGDQMMTAFALDLDARGALRNRAVAVTVMSNLGLRRALAAAGIGVVETPVGDRNVLASLAEHDLVLGGEQSGHVVFADLATTGDGLLTGLLFADLVRRAGRPASAVASAMERFPQVLVNVRVDRRPDLGAAPGLWAEVGAVEAELGDEGRVLVRASGTEPLVRVMVEAHDPDVAEAAAARLEAAVVRQFGPEGSPAARP
ncbi:MAG: phosphoglucosamine mutase [Acidimicrobiia bacterium]|nr:MAG: phosphoglucosamine mutase [Acidimicrobiia bacterium]